MTRISRCRTDGCVAEFEIVAGVAGDESAVDVRLSGTETAVAWDAAPVRPVIPDDLSADPLGHLTGHLLPALVRLGVGTVRTVVADERLGARTEQREPDDQQPLQHDSQRKTTFYKH